jgi:hypothetical protein
MNDDHSPLLTLISIACKKTMRLEKMAPADDGKDVIQYRCEQCSRIEQVQLMRPSGCSIAGSRKMKKMNLQRNAGS